MNMVSVFSRIRISTKYMYKVLIVSGAVSLMAAGCTNPGTDEPPAAGYEETSGRDAGRIDLTTDTRSDSFHIKEEKLAFLKEYLIMPSEVIDAEYHIMFWDNSGGMVPGPSDWDIRAVLKVAEEDIPLWTADMKRILPEQLDLNLWDDLMCDTFIWQQSDMIECYKRPDLRSYLIVNRNDNMIFKYVSTTYIPPAPDQDMISDELSGYDEEKTVVADALGYDHSVLPYVKALQAENVLLKTGEEAELICYRALIYNSPLFGETVMVLKKGNQVTSMVLCEGSYEDVISLADIDGDGYEELLTRHCFTITGGAGGYKTAVYKLTGDGADKVFDYPGWEDSRSNDTGFRLTLADGYRYIVENQYTGSRTEFVRMDKKETPYFDSSGNITEKAGEHNIDKRFGVDPSFFLFEPEDVDQDGVAEIKTAQYTHLWGRSDGIGNAYCVLKWNCGENKFDIVETGFEPYGTK